MTSAKTHWPGFNEMGSLIIPLAWNDVPLEKTAVYIDGERFEPKDELHVTVIGKQAGHELQHRLSRASRNMPVLQRDFESLDWSFTPGATVHLLSRTARDSRKATIVLPLQMPGMAMFYDCLRSRGLVTSDTPLPPPHVTLYHQNCPGGIGIPDEKTLSNLTVQIFPIGSLRLRE